MAWRRATQIEIGECRRAPNEGHEDAKDQEGDTLQEGSG